MVLWADDDEAEAMSRKMVATSPCNIGDTIKHKGKIYKLVKLCVRGVSVQVTKVKKRGGG